MNSSLNQGSARIYQFPAGGRSALGGRRFGERTQAVESTSPHVNEVASSSSWYHEAAIEEEKPEWQR